MYLTVKQVNFDYVNFLIAKSYDDRGEREKAHKIIDLINLSSFKRAEMRGEKIYSGLTIDEE